MADILKKYQFALLCILLAATAAGLLGFAIEPGIGLASDSYHYLSGADTMYDGEGFGRIAGNGEFKPTAHFPPMYSVTLLAARALGGERIRSATVLHQLILILMLLLGAWLVYQMSNSKIMPAVFILVMGYSPALLAVNSWMLSEGLFLLTLTSVLVFVYQFQRTDHIVWLIFAGLVTGVAYLTRYVGVTLAGAVALGILATNRNRPWQSVGVYIPISAVLPVVWLFRNLAVAGVTTNRSLGWHPVSYEKIYSALKVMANWLLPGQVPDPVRIIVLILVAGVLAGVFFLFWKQGERRRTAETSLFCFLLIYPLFLLFSISIFDAATPLDERVLSPIFLGGGLLALTLTSRLMGKMDLAIPKRTALWIGLTLFVGLTLIRGVKQAVALNVDGQGFASSTWRHSELIAWLDTVPQGTVLYSNELDGIYLLTGQVAYQIPIKWDPVKSEVREDFQEQLVAMYYRLEQESGYLLIFESLSGQQAFFPSVEELTRGMSVYLETPLGRVYVNK